MKKIIMLSSLIALFSFCQLSFSAETAHPEPISISSSESVSNAFQLIVRGNGKLTTKPGPVFTSAKERDFILPYLISTPKAIGYPRWALVQGWQGELILALEILMDGSVGRYSVVQSTGYKTLDETGIKSVKTWKFQPAMRDGKPVLTCIQIPIRFQIEEK